MPVLACKLVGFICRALHMVPIIMVFVGGCVMWYRVDTGTMLSYDVCRGLCYMVQGQHWNNAIICL